MQLSALQSVVGWGVVLLEVVLCVLIARRGLYRRLAFFSTYVALVIASDIGRWLVYQRWGYDSWTAWYFGWISQGVLFLMRGLVVAELCWSSLQSYRGIWALTWRVLCGVALLLLLVAALDAGRNTHWVLSFVLTAERGLELVAAMVLLSLLLIGAYYRIRIEFVPWMLALGLCFYSTVQVLNNSFMHDWLTHYLFFWNGVRIGSYQVAMVMWLLALRKPLPARAPAPVLLPQNVYDELSPQVNCRLRVLNERLLELLKS